VVSAARCVGVRGVRGRVRVQADVVRPVLPSEKPCDDGVRWELGEEVDDVLAGQLMSGGEVVGVFDSPVGVCCGICHALTLGYVAPIVKGFFEKCPVLGTDVGPAWSGPGWSVADLSAAGLPVGLLFAVLEGVCPLIDSQHVAGCSGCLVLAHVWIVA